jgi:phospholipid/cholesterol/gamma-HCH transport system substrate-binding protein
MTHSGMRFRLKGVAVLAFAAGAAAIVLYFLSLSGMTIIPHATYVVHLTVPDAVSLADDADVLEAGVKVGSVSGIAAAPDGTRLTLTLNPRYAPIDADAQATIGEKSLVGENYVALDPGDPSTGAIRNGGTLPALGPESTQLDQILSTFDAGRRQDVKQILDVLGAGLGGHGAQLNAFLGGSSDLVDSAAPVGAVLATDRGQLAALIDDFGSVARALGGRTADVRVLVSAARTASTAVAARDGALRHGLTALAPFLAQASTTTRDLGGFSVAATPVMANLRQAAAVLVPAVSELRPAALATRLALARLPALARAATPTVNRLRTFAPAVLALLGPLQTVLRQTNPTVAYLSPYALVLGTLFANVGSVGAESDQTGHYGRVLPDVNSQILSGVLPAAQDKDFQELLKLGLLGSIAAPSSNPYPKPGALQHIAALQAFSGRYQRVTEDPPYALGRP